MAQRIAHNVVRTEAPSDNQVFSWGPDYILARKAGFRVSRQSLRRSLPIISINVNFGSSVVEKMQIRAEPLDGVGYAKNPGLIPYRNYTRQQVHDIFAPETRLMPQAGTWGLHGIVPIPRQPGDWVFYVTFGKRQAHHTFQEHISPEGLLEWQSQPRQSLSDPIMKSWIHLDANANNIHLFLRIRQPGPYWYLGRLAYVSHDTRKERPVFFTWQILEWDPPDTIREALRLPATPSKQMTLTAVVASGHFLYVQKFSQDTTLSFAVMPTVSKAWRGFQNMLRARR